MVIKAREKNKPAKGQTGKRGVWESIVLEVRKRWQLYLMLVLPIAWLGERLGRAEAFQEFLHDKGFRAPD